MDSLRVALLGAEAGLLALHEAAQMDEMRRWESSATWTSLFMPPSDGGKR